MAPELPPHSKVSRRRSSIGTLQNEKLCQLISLGTSNKSQRIKAAQFLSSNANVSWLSRHPFGELCYQIFRYGGSLDPSIRTSPVPQKDTLLYGAGHKLQLRKASKPLEAIQPFVGHHGYKLQREQISPTRRSSGAGGLKTTAPQWNFHEIGTGLNGACVFRFPSTHASRASSPYCKIWSHKAASCLPIRKKKGPMGLPRHRTGR